MVNFFVYFLKVVRISKNRNLDLSNLVKFITYPSIRIAKRIFSATCKLIY